jgi:FkbM family methyltransferase
MPASRSFSPYTKRGKWTLRFRTTLDTLAEEGTVDVDEVGLLWLDVEGHELDVLTGATTLLERSVPM